MIMKKEKVFTLKKIEKDKQTGAFVIYQKRLWPWPKKVFCVFYGKGYPYNQDIAWSITDAIMFDLDRDFAIIF